jgi:hypothetical protein
MLSFFLLSVALAGAPARAADTTMLLQGNGSVTYFAEGQSLTCPGTINVGLRIAGADFQIAESFGQPAPNPSGNIERQASCAINTALFVFEADNSGREQQVCVPNNDVQFVHLDGIGLTSGPYTLSGNGSATTPYIIQYSATLCDGSKYLDKVTLRTAAPMSYKHELSNNGVVQFRTVATLARVA